MLNQLYQNFLHDPAEYAASEVLWLDRWAELLRSANSGAAWVCQWLETRFPNGEPFRDGNPIFSAIAPSLKRAVRVIQHAPTAPSLELVYWIDTIDPDDGSPPVKELVISCALSDAAVQRASELIFAWIVRGRLSPSRPEFRSTGGSLADREAPASG